MLKSEPKNIDALMFRAELQRVSGDSEGASAALREALEERYLEIAGGGPAA